MSKKDMRRADLIIPYIEPESDKDTSADVGSTFATTLPMAAIFTKNKALGWASVLFTLQNWLAEGPNQASKASTPAYLGILMSLAAVATTYLPLFLPPVGTRNPQPVPIPPATP